MGAQQEDVALRLEGGAGCYDASSNVTTSVGAPPASPTSRKCCPKPKELPGSAAFRTVLLGQVLSALIALMSISAASLDDRGVNLPSFVNFINYVFIMLGFFFPMLLSRPSLELALPWWRYALYAAVDVEANTLAVLAFRYTSITSVAMLDAFSIPAVMVLSRVLLRAEYNGKHLFGVALCLIGLGLTVVSDLEGETAEEHYPHALRGDVLCVMGATLYAGSNVMQEDFVKNYDRVEFLGMAGLFGAIISGVQTLAFEREALAEVEWTTPVILYTVGYGLSLSVMYSWTSLFLLAGDAALFNLSLLTSDVYALLFAYVVEQITPDWLYFVAFAVIFWGLIVYHLQPPPTSADPSLRLDFLGGGCCWGRARRIPSLRDLDCGDNNGSFTQLPGESGGSSASASGSSCCVKDEPVTELSRNISGGSTTSTYIGSEYANSPASVSQSLW
ncbi:unnamed protein product [Scytosiphon promiscuus]